MLICNHVSTKSLGKIRSPLDSIDMKEGVGKWQKSQTERCSGISARIGINELATLMNKLDTHCRQVNKEPLKKDDSVFLREMVITSTEV